MFEKPTPVVTVLIAACVICYIPQLIGFNVNAVLAVSPYSLAYYPWQLVTAMFAHSSIEHLLMNMVSLWWLGTLLERMQGSIRFALVYLVSGVVGNLAFAFIGNGYAVGASGAIFGLLGAVALMLYSMRENVLARSMFGGLMAMLALNIVNSFVPGIALEAHFGGLVAGAAVEGLFLLLGWKPKPEPQPHIKPYAKPPEEPPAGF